MLGSRRRHIISFSADSPNPASQGNDHEEESTFLCCCQHCNLHPALPPPPIADKELPAFSTGPAGQFWPGVHPPAFEELSVLKALSTNFCSFSSQGFTILATLTCGIALQAEGSFHVGDHVTPEWQRHSPCTGWSARMSPGASGCLESCLGWHDGVGWGGGNQLK